MKRGLLYFILILFLTFDVAFSFLQHYSFPLDGDMAEGVLQAGHTSGIFNDPFGLNAALGEDSYPNPNRFFAHWLNSYYFMNMPLALQEWTSPINSIYLSIAIIKTLIQAGLIALLSWCILGMKRSSLIDFLIAASLVTPLFNNTVYHGYMGILDKAPTYFFFYALPFFFLLLFFVHFARPFVSESKEVGVGSKLLQVALAIVLPFSGPLIPGIILIAIPMFFLARLISDWQLNPEIPFLRYLKTTIIKIPGFQVFILIFICLLSLYSLYIGRSNSIDSEHSLSLLERYSRLPEGIFYQFTQKLGWPLLFAALIINTIIISRSKNSKAEKIIRIFKWILAFTIIYIILLPLGGYREYRPFILRWDTILPITVLMVFYFGYSSWFLLNFLKGTRQKIYMFGVISFLVLFTVSDEPNFEANQCEREAMAELAASDADTVFIQKDCTLMSWDKIHDPELSRLQGRLFYHWNVTDKSKFYYQIEPK